MASELIGVARISTAVIARSLRVSSPSDAKMTQSPGNKLSGSDAILVSFISPPVSADRKTCRRGCRDAARADKRPAATNLESTGRIE